MEQRRFREIEELDPEMIEAIIAMNGRVPDNFVAPYDGGVDDPGSHLIRFRGNLRDDPSPSARRLVEQLDAATDRLIEETKRQPAA